MELQCPGLAIVGYCGETKHRTVSSQNGRPRREDVDGYESIIWRQELGMDCFVFLRPIAGNDFEEIFGGFFVYTPLMEEGRTMDTVESRLLCIESSGNRRIAAY
jgi:hypothetical protein